jgi:MFS family permease
VTVWAPTFVHDLGGASLAKSSIYGSASINIAGFVAVPLGGLFADMLAKRTPVGRFYMLVIGLALAGILLLPMAFARSGPVVGVILIATTLGKGLFDGCIYAAMQDVIPPHARATAIGLMTTCGFIGAGIAPLFIAQASRVLGMASSLASLGVLYGVAAVLILIFRSQVRRAVLANSTEVA